MPYAHKVPPGAKVNLKDHNPADTAGLAKPEGVKRIAKLGEEIGELQELMYAADNTALLVVFQGRDTSGKDGAIKKILSYINVQSTKVASFKVPTDEELSHDFLWRIHKQTPERGAMTVFNRSHYEDVLVVRVHNLVPEKVWRPRYEAINNFEKLLDQSNTLILKFYLHISKEEQEERLLEREGDPTKAWKLAVGDWKERELWDQYTAAYEEALSRCSTKAAPWHIVPADKKWFRDLAVAEAIAEALRPAKKEWMKTLETLGAVAKTELEAFRSQQTGQRPP